MMGSTQAAAQTATSAAVQSALHELPNYVVDGCTVTCTYAYKIGVSALYPSVSCDIGFNGASVAGPQYLLEVEADKCDSGCTPQLSDPVQLKSALVASTAAEYFKAPPPAETTIATGNAATNGGAVSDTDIDVTLNTGGLDAVQNSYIRIGSEVMLVTAVSTCVEINQCVGCTRQFFTKSFLGDDAAVLARSSGEEPASPRHRAGVASMAWRTTR